MRTKTAAAMSILLAVAGCQQATQTPGVDRPARPIGQYEHPAQTAGGLQSVDPEAYPQTPGFTDAERPPAAELHGGR